MSSAFPRNSISKSGNINPFSLLRLCKLNLMMKFLEIETKFPNLTQKQIAED